MKRLVRTFGSSSNWTALSGCLDSSLFPAAVASTLVGRRSVPSNRRLQYTFVSSRRHRLRSGRNRSFTPQHWSEASRISFPNDQTQTHRPVVAEDKVTSRELGALTGVVWSALFDMPFQPSGSGIFDFRLLALILCRIAEGAQRAAGGFIRATIRVEMTVTARACVFSRATIRAAQNATARRVRPACLRNTVTLAHRSLCRTSKMSHGCAWRASCASTRRDKRSRWLWRLVRLFGVGNYHPQDCGSNPKTRSS